ncbi:MAG: peptidylprolyl isomerase [Desulfovibrio sp.]|nr:peptidylprolyl isomerase [Desulfovibrio sp.]
MGTIVQTGSNVTVHYTGTLEDGTVFDSSRGREPLVFEQGKGMLIKGFENAVEGRAAGETVTVTIPPAEAYGEYDPRQIFSVAKAQVPDSIPLEIGTKLQLSSEKGVLFVTISDITDEEVTLDGNHELAGKTLTFEIEILSVS